MHYNRFAFIKHRPPTPLRERVKIAATALTLILSKVGLGVSVLAGDSSMEFLECRPGQLLDVAGRVLASPRLIPSVSIVANRVL